MAAEGMCALTHCETLSVGPGSGSSSGSAILGIAVVPHEEMLTSVCLMVFLLVLPVLCWEALVMLV